MLTNCIRNVLFPILILLPISAEAIYLQPVPENFIEGNALSAPDLNFYVEAPGQEWDWLVASETQGEGKNTLRLFACSLYDLRRVAITVSEPYWYPPTVESTSRLMNGMIEGFELEGFTATASVPEPSNIPLPGSYRFKIVGENKFGAIRYIYGYYAVRGRAFSISEKTVEDSEPADFTTLVSSFRFIGEPPPGPWERVPRFYVLVAISLVILVGGVGWIINKVSGRFVFNQWKVALIVQFLAAIVVVVLWFSKIPSPEALGAFTFNYLFVPFFWPVLFASWRSREYEKRKSAEVGKS